MVETVGTNTKLHVLLQDFEMCIYTKNSASYPTLSNSTGDRWSSSPECSWRGISRPSIFKKSFPYKLLLVSIRRKSAAYSTNGLLLKHAVRHLENSINARPS